MAKELTVGDKAPALSLPDQSGEPVSLKDFTGKQVVLDFVPKNDTPGRTKESCDFLYGSCRSRWGRDSA